MKCPALKVVFALFTSQVKENELHFLLYSDFWFLPCSNPNSDTYVQGVRQPVVSAHVEWDEKDPSQRTEAGGHQVNAVASR